MNGMVSVTSLKLEPDHGNAAAKRRGNDSEMTIRLSLLTSILLLIGVACMSGQNAETPAVTIQLSSDPFPLAVGRSTLLVSLNASDDSSTEGAAVQVSSQITQGGLLTLPGQAVRSANGVYEIPMIWPRMGEWTVDVTAVLPDGRGTLQERFELYVYMVQPLVESKQSAYQSVSETNAAVSANAAEELWIVIPPGTDEMVMEGLSGELIPSEIRLQVTGQNVLVIRNNDFADHTVGPFFVRAGETVRQVFTQPAVYTGTCSITHSAEISIVVEA
jgi:hypothetical protein